MQTALQMAARSAHSYQVAWSSPRDLAAFVLRRSFLLLFSAAFVILRSVT